MRVEASFGNKSEELEKQKNNQYYGEVTSPSEHGDYDVIISAYDNYGNIAVAERQIEVTQWKDPKINWQPSDPVNYTDYNRIKNNLEYLWERGNQLFRPFSIVDMGEDKKSYKEYTYADEWNAFENNLDTINRNTANKNYGQKKRFFDNGQFINWEELNRLESAIMSIKNIMDRLESGLPRLAVRFGNVKGVKV